MRSVIAKFLRTLKSPPRKPGPRNALRPTGPSKPVLATKSDELQHCRFGHPPGFEKVLCVKAAVGWSRIVAPPRFWPVRLSSVAPSIMLNGKPLRQNHVPDTIHPPMAAFTIRFSLLNGN